MELHPAFKESVVSFHKVAPTIVLKGAMGPLEMALLIGKTGNCFFYP